MDVVSMAEPSSVSDGRRKTGAGKGRPAGMAILDPEIRRIGLEPPVREGLRHADDLGDHAIAVARVRRHALRRLLSADVVGLVVAAIAGPLLALAIIGRFGMRGVFASAAVPGALCVLVAWIGIREVRKQVERRAPSPVQVCLGTTHPPAAQHSHI